jgi:sterol desaturase/sphingolipid hydroxylase (fatty acid hydroxylase superfamily)
MSAKKIFYISSLLILPVLYGLFCFIHVATQGRAIDQWLPKWDRVLIIFAIIVLERIYTYRYAVSQRAVLTRDVIANVVNLYLTGPVTAMLVLPVLVFFPEHFFGRKLVFASPEQLGPFWLQIAVILVSVSFFRYWMHRLQHTNELLWELHSYHHRVTDLKASNGEVSNPVDFALRNVVVFLVLGIIGFDPFAILLAVTATNVTSAFSNYGVEFSFWDSLFGTFYMPQKDGRFVQPERIGHPGGLPDKSNYLKLLLAPLGLYRPLPRLRRTPTGPEPAE